MEYPCCRPGDFEEKSFLLETFRQKNFKYIPVLPQLLPPWILWLMIIMITGVIIIISSSVVVVVLIISGLLLFCVVYFVADVSEPF